MKQDYFSLSTPGQEGEPNFAPACSYVNGNELSSLIIPFT
jgi:hypothetical protein